jgi:hypothetical protein
LPSRLKLFQLFSLGCINRANACASAAVDAGTCVDNSYITFERNCADGALINTRTAADASISNFHKNDLLF